jgi:hypothetical protein
MEFLSETFEQHVFSSHTCHFLLITGLVVYLFLRYVQINSAVQTGIICCSYDISYTSADVIMLSDSSHLVQVSLMKLNVKAFCPLQPSRMLRGNECENKNIHRVITNNVSDHVTSLVRT